MKKSNKTMTRILLTTTAFVGALTLSQQAWSDDAACHLGADGTLPDGCERADAGLAVTMPVGRNAEPAGNGIANDAGFVFSIDGEALNSDDRVENRARRADVALAEAELQVKFDGLDATRRLGLSTGSVSGGAVLVESHVNYPAYVSRAEFIVYDTSQPGLTREVARVPVAPGGRTEVPVTGPDMVIAHRVYDSRGRFDETTAVAPDSGTDGRGVDMATRRGIPEQGGAVTVSGQNLRPGATVRTLDTTVSADPGGSFVVDRVLPPGTYDVDVVAGGVDITRQVEIPASDLFYIGVADVTIGRRDGELNGDETYTRGRVQLYARGTTASGYRIIAALDTREGELDELFDDLGDRDPRALFDRLSPGEGYTVFGDDSTFEETAPTAGKVYLRVERGTSSLVWGNTQTAITGNGYLRNERTLYGASAQWDSVDTTERGEARASVTAFASQAERAAGRDVFQGTGGSIFFLSRNDVTRGSEVVTVQVRDSETGRVVETRRLAAGTDYTVNYIQGSIILTAPLSGTASTGLISNPGGDADVALIVQYEFAPTGGLDDGLAYGGRAEYWATDDVRLGVTALGDESNAADQTARGVDLRYQIGENSHVQLDYAESDGPGFGSRTSLDGGLIFDSDTPVTGDGRAVRLEGVLDFADLGLDREGDVGFYLEDRTAGFSSLDYNVADDEELAGVSFNAAVTDRLDLSGAFDVYRNDAGREINEVALTAEYALNPALSLAFGLAHLDREGTGSDGTRTDAALRLTRLFTDGEAYVFVQGTLEADGLDDNNRIGVGGQRTLGNGWGVEGEVSGGNLGAAAKARLTYAPDENRSLYFGYELDPARSFDGFNATSSDAKRTHMVAGGRQQVTDRVAVFGENSYDLFGQQRSLLATYGVEYAASEHTTFSARIEQGDFADPDTDDFERTGLSLGLSHDDGDRLVAAATLEWRRDRGDSASSLRDAETLGLAASARYKLNERQRLLFSVNAVTTDNANSSELDGTYTEVALGYARRPVEDDRLNVLFQYRYLSDEYGQRIDGSDELGLQQRSHILSVDAEYDLNNHWSLGGKIGARIGESRSDETVAYAGNDATLAVINARYHLTHKWDLLAEARMLDMSDAGTRESGALVAGYRHFGNNVKAGLGYNFSEFSDDLGDLSLDDRGVFLNIVAKF